jgi:hypothetical protein
LISEKVFVELVEPSSNPRKETVQGVPAGKPISEKVTVGPDLKRACSSTGEVGAIVAFTL